MKRTLLIALALIGLLPTGWVVAHEIRPAFLQINEQEPGNYQVMWKVPRIDERAPNIIPGFAQSFSLKESGDPLLIDGYVVFRYQLQGEQGLPGTRLRIDGLSRTTIDVLVELTLTDGSRHSFLLQPASNEVDIPLVPSNWEVVWTYVKLGVEHILLGIDHLLFVLALILITRGGWKIAKTITAFTIAHSITLSAAALGFVNVPGPPVEAVIALSIVFLALEVLRGLDGEPTLTGQKPWLVAFTFGLLHGFGFAGALSEIGLPQTAIPLALASFNIGVELGQLAFVAVVLVILSLLRLKHEWPNAIKRVPAYAIGSVSAFWLIERVLSFALPDLMV